MNFFEDNCIFVGEKGYKKNSSLPVEMRSLRKKV